MPYFKIRKGDGTATQVNVYETFPASPRTLEKKGRKSKHVTVKPLPSYDYGGAPS